MKKLSIIALSIPLFLSSCTSSVKAKSRGIIDCSFIYVEGSKSSFNKSYSTTYAPVFSYKSADSKIIYCNKGTIPSKENNQSDTKLYIRFYKDRYTKDYVDYFQDGFIGWLSLESNYYLDLDTRTIDCETKYSEYLYSENPENDIDADNKEAYKCAKKGYYQYRDYIYYSEDEDGNYYYILKADSETSALVSHKYIYLGSDDRITYTEKLDSLKK